MIVVLQAVGSMFGSIGLNIFVVVLVLGGVCWGILSILKFIDVVKGLFKK